MNIEEKIQLIHCLNIAITNSSLYSVKHDVVVSLTDECMVLLNRFFQEKERLRILRIGNELIMNDMPIKVNNIHVNTFIKRLKRRGIERIDISRGITKEEVYGLIVDLAKHSDEPLKQSSHLSSGKVEVKLGVSETATVDEDNTVDETGLTEEIDHVKEVMKDALYFKRLDVAGLEDIVVNFIAILKREANILNILTPFKAQSEYTYTHATNVAILSLFQAESLGTTGEALHDIGISALLHDVGKIQIPKEILYKEGKLDEKEWEKIQHHTIYGAKYLLGMNGITPLAPIVALEHHMKYDGSGYPAISKHNKKQHIISQMVAISDFYDALRQKRPYKEGLPEKDIFEIMGKGADKEFNPILLNNFILKIREVYQKWVDHVKA